MVVCVWGGGGLSFYLKYAYPPTRKLHTHTHVIYYYRNVFTVDGHKT